MTKPMTKDDLQGLLDGSPFTKFLGVKVTEADADQGSVVLRMESRLEIQRIDGSPQIHGGPLAALIDTAGDLAVAQAVGGAVPTIDMKVDYLRPVMGDYVLARAQARRVGRTVGVADIEIVDAEDRLCAIGRAVYAARIG
ncbi:MAG: PaaI family thioesterase [Pseudomonadota bacterium]